MADGVRTPSSILIVDDDKFLLDMYTVKFKEKGFAVTLATSGEEAVRKLKEGCSPSAVLLDVIMPGMDGFGLLQAIKQENLASGAVKIMLTNQGQQPEIDRAMKLGADGYIIKATSIPSEVLSQVIAIIDTKQAHA